MYTLLKVVSYYDLSALSMSVMGFQKKKFGWGVGGWGELYPSFFFDFWNLFNLQGGFFMSMPGEVKYPTQGANV